MYLFDTTYIIDLLSDDQGALEKAKEIDSIPAFKAISVITVQEYLRGIYYLFGKDKNLLKSKLKEAEKDLSHFEVLQVDYLTVKIAAEIDANLLRNGTPLSLPDVLIAASALQYSLTLITRNKNDFDKIAEISDLIFELY
ncbi:MAG: type II toxin-antitoxin system VapC family toxin [Candidatus Helarchaeota archaeon]